MSSHRRAGPPSSRGRGSTPPPPPSAISSGVTRGSTRGVLGSAGTAVDSLGRPCALAGIENPSGRVPQSPISSPAIHSSNSKRPSYGDDFQYGSGSAKKPMFPQWFHDALATVDCFPKIVSSAKTVRSSSGGVVALVTVAFITYLCLYNIMLLSQVDVVHSVSIDNSGLIRKTLTPQSKLEVDDGHHSNFMTRRTSRDEELIPMTFTITLPKVHCDLLSVDTMNIFEEQQRDIISHVVKQRIKDGVLLDDDHYDRHIITRDGTETKNKKNNENEGVVVQPHEISDDHDIDGDIVDDKLRKSKNQSAIERAAQEASIIRERMNEVEKNSVKKRNISKIITISASVMTPTPALPTEAATEQSKDNIEVTENGNDTSQEVSADAPVSDIESELSNLESEGDGRNRRRRLLGKAEIDDNEEELDEFGNASPSACLACPSRLDLPKSFCCNTCEDLRNAFLQRGKRPSNNVYRKDARCVRWLSKLQTSGQGCRISADLKVNRVGGNVHIAPGKSFQKKGWHYHDLWGARPHTFDSSHTFHSLIFGDPIPPFNPPVKEMVEELGDDHSAMFKYFVKVVPATYIYLNGTQTNSYTYSLTYQFNAIDEKSGQGIPGVFIFYELSSMTTKFEEQRRSTFLSFCTHICAVLGGTISVGRLIDVLCTLVLTILERQFGIKINVTEVVVDGNITRKRSKSIDSVDDVGGGIRPVVREWDIPRRASYSDDDDLGVPGRRRSDSSMEEGLDDSDGHERDRVNTLDALRDSVDRD